MKFLCPRTIQYFQDALFATSSKYFFIPLLFHHLSAQNSAALCFSTSWLTCLVKTSLGNSLYSLWVSRSSWGFFFLCTLFKISTSSIFFAAWVFQWGYFLLAQAGLGQSLRCICTNISSSRTRSLSNATRLLSRCNTWENWGTGCSGYLTHEFVPCSCHEWVTLDQGGHVLDHS